MDPTYAPAGTPTKNPANTATGTTKLLGAISATLTIAENAPVSPIIFMKVKNIPTLNYLTKI